jgi:uncharacterized protein (TIGR04141 family)
MPRPPSNASKTSLNRIALAPDVALVNAAKSEYLDRDTFKQEQVTIGPRPAILIYGQITTESPDWLDHAQSLTSFRPACQNDTSASMLVLRLNDTDEYCYALTWGMGHLLLDSSRIDDGFGLRFALRRADAKQISALTTHALDTLPRTARLSVFGGTAIIRSAWKRSARLSAESSARSLPMACLATSRTAPRTSQSGALTH